MAAEEDNGAYTITWQSKPLGFSIVMDTTGRNAYVSSIQKQENLQKGLKLAAQIIRINDENVKQMKHGDILDRIRNAALPMELTFQPRSFANEPQGGNRSKAKSTDVPKGLLFAGAPASARNRVDGVFELVESESISPHNGREVWQRKDSEEDPVILWFWPTSVSGLTTDLWMIGRKTKIDTQDAYACVASSTTNPLLINKAWKIFDKEAGNFVDCTLNIADSVDPTKMQDY